MKRTRHLVVLLTYTLLTLAATYPLPLRLATAVPNDIGDPLLNVWIMAWDSHALLTGPLNLFNANIFYPLPDTLAYSEHLFSTALLAQPLLLITQEPVLAYNLSLLATFPLAGFGMYLLALRYTGRRAAFIAGLVFAFAPYRLAAIAHLQLLTFQWMPYALLLLDTITAPGQRRPATARHYAAFAALLTWQILAAWYLAVYAGLIVGGHLIFALWRGRLNRRSAGRLALTLGLAAALALPFGLPYLRQLDALQQARPLSMAVSLAARPADFAAAPPFNRLFGPLTAPLRARPGFTEEHTLFAGVVAPLLALAGVMAVLAGKRIGRNKASPPPGNILFPLLLVLVIAVALTFAGPYAALVSLLPPASVVRVPARWIIPALFALSAPAAFGSAAIAELLSRRGKLRPLRHLFPALAALLILAESLSVPLPLAPVDNRATLNPVYRRLAQQPAPFALIELPLHSAPNPEYPEVKRLYASTLGWWPLVNGYSGYTPPRQPELAQALTTFPDRQSVAALQRLAAGLQPASLPLYALVHPDEAPFSRPRWDATDRRQLERNPAAYPLGQFEGAYLYRIMPAGSLPASEPPQ
ncbi:MAG: hypothetical protein ACE5G8_12255, partial [Anaerolineae bacterium]